MKKKMNSLKVVSIVLAVSLCASLVTACNGDGQIDDRTTQPSTRETLDPAKIGLDEPNQSIETMDTSAIETETETTATETAAPTGAYTYTVYAGTEYETTLSMNVNIDDYIMDIDGPVPFFSIGYLTRDLGWLGNGDPNYTSSDPLRYYAFDYGNNTQMIWFGNGSYSESNPTTFPQLRGFDYHLAPTSNYLEDARTSEEIQSSYSNYGVIVSFCLHADELCYNTVVNGESVSISRDDAIIIAFIFSSAASYPGENPFIGTNLEEATISRTERNLEYRLP